MRPTAQPARTLAIAHANLLLPPGKNQLVNFEPGFGQRVLLTVDTEEEFDWSGEFRREGNGLDHVRWIAKFQQFCEGQNIAPVYLVDWPVAQSEIAQDIIGTAVRNGTAEVGVQLHPWVNPPHEEKITGRNSFAGNLAPELERAKFRRLRDAVEENFGAVPRIYRAGRYGLGPDTAAMLAETGIAIDSSVRARFDYSYSDGPDYRHHPATPYWADADRNLMELPLTTVFWGMLRRQGKRLFPTVRQFPILVGACSALGLLERIPLTPEGTSIDEAVRGLDMAIDDGLPIIVLSFHSPSLAPGHTPYVRNADDLDAFYDWFRAVYYYCERAGVRPTTVKEIMASVVV